MRGGKNEINHSYEQFSNWAIASLSTSSVSQSEQRYRFPLTVWKQAA